MTGNSFRDNVHKLVQEQYDKFPYPQAPGDLHDFISRKAFQGGCPSQFFHLYWPFKEKNNALDILVAGCGTMQAPKFAVNLPESRITAIDICDNSIDHTNRLLKLHNIRNVTTHKLPIEDAGTLGKQFDLIISTGVLHHLPEPAVGLNTLQSLLRDDGSMYLMLYGKYGRDGIYYIQELLRRAGLTASTATPSDLSIIRQLLNSLPQYHPVSAKKHFFGNFQVGDIELVDLFLHPQDRGYSLPDIVNYLDSCNMQLQTLLFRAHYAPRCSGLVLSGLFDRITCLPEIEQFAIGELYRAAAYMHFFVACKKQRNESTFRIDLDGPGWKNLVPVKAHGIYQDRTSQPDDYIATLYSRMHQFADIRCHVQADELAMFERSGNRHSIGEIQDILKDTRPGIQSDDYVRNFYKKMHDYDIMTFRGTVHARH